MNSEQRARELLADCLSEFGCDGAGYAVRHEQEGRENLLYPAALRAIARALEQPASAAGVEGMVCDTCGGRGWIDDGHEQDDGRMVSAPEDCPDCTKLTTPHARGHPQGEYAVKDWPSDVAFIAEVMPDWTTLQLPSGQAFGFNRETGRVYRLPHPDCPFAIIGPPPEATRSGEGDEVVGHKTFSDGKGGFRHEPLTRAEADVLIAHCNSEDERRKALIPDEQSAIRLMMDAYIRLKEMGWNDAIYCPKDGRAFEVIEPGSTGIFKCVYQGEWPKGTWWIVEDGDMSPSRPVLFRSLAASRGEGGGALEGDK